jgi:hypothetical protein
MPLRRLLTAVAAAGSFAGAFAIVHASVVSPVSGLSASAAVSVGQLPTRDHTQTARPFPAPTPVLTPVPTPVPVVQQAASTPVPVPVPVPVVSHPVVAPPPAPAPPPLVRNYLTSADGTLHTGVGAYTDCSGRTPLTHATAAIDTCIRGPLYFVGHNVGVFTPLMHMEVGAIITYNDGAGTAHVWRVSSVRASWASANGVPPATGPDVVAQFQTCVVADGSVDRILDVVAA